MNRVTRLAVIATCVSICFGEDTKHIPATEPPVIMSYQESMNEMMIGVMNKCNETFTIEMSYWVSLISDSGTFPDETDKTPKCYIRCVLESTEVADMQGMFNPMRAAALFSGKRGDVDMPVQEVQDMAAKCANERDETCKCERSYEFLKCLMMAEIDKYEMGDMSGN